MARKKNSVIAATAIHDRHVVSADSLQASGRNTALLVPPSVPRLIPDLDGAPSNTVAFTATFQPLRVEIPMWAHSNPSEENEEYLSLYWNGTLIETKTFDQPVLPESRFILVPVRHLVEGPHRLHYEVTIFNDTQATSRPLEINIDKTAPLLNPDDDRLGFPDYVLDQGATEEYLAANGDQLKATLPPYLGAQVGDTVKWFWSDDPVGQDMAGVMTLTDAHIEPLHKQSKPITLIYSGDFIRQSKNGTRFARYEVQDRAGTAPQRALARAIKSDPSPPPRELPPPRLKEALGSDYFSTLSPRDALGGVTLVIPDAADIRPNETVTVFWGEPGTLGGYSTSTPTAPGSREYLIPRLHVAPHMNQRVTLRYQINKPDVPGSPVHHVTVRAIEGLPTVQSSKIHNGALNLRTMGESISFTLPDWAFRHTSQFINAWIEGVRNGDVSKVVRIDIADALPVTTEAGTMVLGSVSKADLLQLAINYQFRVSVEVSFDDKASWLKFPDAAAQLEDR